MPHQLSDETVNRFTIAAAELLRRDLSPEFAEDSASLVFVAGPPLDGEKLAHWSIETKTSQMDIVYFTFEPGREHFGPTGATIFAERLGTIFRWPDCVLWAPKDGGPLLIMPKDLNVCFSQDGRALISHPTRPTQSLRNGTARAHQRLLRASREVTAEQLDRVAAEWRSAA
jgi:hypothetical protein